MQPNDKSHGHFLPCYFYGTDIYHRANLVVAPRSVLDAPRAVTNRRKVHAVRPSTGTDNGLITL